MQRSSVLSFLCISSSLLLGALSHPLCTNGFTAQAEGGINFCTDYADSSCCNGGRDAELANVVQQLGVTDETCRDFLRQAVCTECDPWAAHLRGEEPAVKDVPWMCQAYCESFYQACGFVTLAGAELPPFFTTRISDTWPDVEQFCAQFANSLPWGYCYSGVPYAPAETPGFSSPDGICLDLVIPNAPWNADFWTDFVEIPDNTNRMVSISRQGLMRVYQKTADGPFLELGNFLQLQGRVTIEGEGGLLGLAFHPNYAQNRKFYVSYTCDPAVHDDCKLPCVTTQDCPTNEGTCAGGFCTNHVLMNIIQEYVAQAGNPNVAEPVPLKTVLKVSQPGGNHNGGQILMGPDGFLYAFLGDGGANGGHKAQDRLSLLGKVLRLDINTAQPYVIPNDNPFVNDPNTRSEIWALGFRNPWKSSFDSLTGALWMGDVGQDTIEEVNLVVKGGNYGWRKYEGSINRETGDQAIPDHVLPEFFYGHDATAGSQACIIGGVVYRGSKALCHFEEYIFADLDGYFFSAHDDTGDWVYRQISWACGSGASPLSCIGQTISKIYGFSEDSAKDLFISTNFGIVKVVQGDRCPALHCDQTSPPTSSTTQVTSSTTTQTTSSTTTQTTSEATRSMDSTTTQATSSATSTSAEGTSTETSQGITSSSSQGTYVSTSLGTSGSRTSTTHSQGVTITQTTTSDIIISPGTNQDQLKEEESSADGLAGGPIASIVLSLVLFFALIAVAAFVVHRYKSKVHTYVARVQTRARSMSTAILHPRQEE